MEDRRLRLTTSPAMLALVALSLAPALAGCGQKAKECKAVIEKVNAGSERLQAFDKKRRERPSGGKEQAIQEYEEVSKIYDEIHAEVKGVPVTDKGLKEHTDAYWSAAKKAGAAAQALASAHKAKVPAAAKEADEKFTAAMKEQEAAVAKINDYCH